MQLRAAIVAQGDEILAGTTQDTNSSWLARELWARGLWVVSLAAVPDDEDRIATVLRQAAETSDVVICSGGLGPTADDLTAAAVALASGRPLQLDPVALEQVAARFQAMGVAMPASNRKQALLPRGAELLENSGGTAPGFAVDLAGARAFFFPGVPRELFAMAERHLFPWLAERGCAARLRRRLHVCGVGESALQDRLGDLPLPDGVRLGFKTWIPFNTVVLYGEPGLERDLEQAVQRVRERLGLDCFGQDETTLPMAVGQALVARGWTLALAESCTAGGAAHLLTEAAGSSEWFAGGVVSYANAVKRDQLGVSQEILDSHGAVSEPCAKAMAEGVRRALGVDVGVSITGVAGPGGGSAEKPVGLVCFGLALPDGTRTRTIRFGDRGREWVRTLAAASAVEWLRRRLVKIS